MRPCSSIIALVGIYCCCCMIQTAMSAPAPGTSRTSENKPQNSGNSPQLLYMKTLHDRIKGAKVKMGAEEEIKDKDTSGTLIATSFEVTGDVTGAGWNSSGFSLENGNQLILSFMLPNPGDSIGIYETDLWLFPKPSQLRNDSIMDLTLLVVVELAHATKPRREVMNYSWRMDSSCLRLNMTGLSRKVINNLQKRGLEKTNISVSIEVIAAREPEVIQETTIVLDTDLREGCSALHDRNNNEPFLVMKYYNEEQLAAAQLEDSSSEEGSSSQSRQQKRQSDSDQSATPTAGTSTTTSAPSWNGCSVAPLTVNLTKAFGDFIIMPKEINIQDCHGSCNTGRNPDRFTLHAKIKEQVKLTEGVNAFQRGDACCAPSSFKHQDLLIRKENYVAIVSFPDMVVAGCHCS